MSVDTCAIINRPVTLEEIYSFIAYKYDKAARLDLGTPYRDKPSGSIYFHDGNDERRLFVCLDTDDYKNEYPELKFLDDKKSYAYVDLGFWHNSIDIIKSIANQFGAYVDENDSDDEGYYYMDSNPDKDVPPVIRVTMKEIREKFGGVVIITDR